VSIGASEHHPRPSRTLGQEKTGRAVANTNVLTLSPHTKKGNPHGPPKILLTQNDAGLPHVLTPSVVQH
jgi:hypothetical protein